MDKHADFPKTTAARTIPAPWTRSAAAAAELLLGLVLLGLPYLLGVSVAWVGGAVLLLAGALRLMQGARHLNHRPWNVMAGVMFLCMGAAMAFSPMLSMHAWTQLVGLALLVGGCMQILMAVGMVYMPGAFWRFFVAMATVVLGAMVTWGWPESSLWLVGTLVAVELICSAWAMLFLSLTPARPYAA